MQGFCQAFSRASIKMPTLEDAFERFSWGVTRVLRYKHPLGYAENTFVVVRCDWRSSCHDAPVVIHVVGNDNRAQRCPQHWGALFCVSWTGSWKEEPLFLPELLTKMVVQAQAQKSRTYLLGVSRGAFSLLCALSSPRFFGTLLPKFDGIIVVGGYYLRATRLAITRSHLRGFEGAAH